MEGESEGGDVEGRVREVRWRGRDEGGEVEGREEVRESEGGEVEGRVREDGER